MTRREVITNILVGVYGDRGVPRALAERIDREWNTRYSTAPLRNRDELANYIWMNMSGGNTAYDAAEKIRAAVSQWERNR